MGMLAVDAGFIAFLAAAATHVAVKAAPQAARNQHVAAQVKAEREFYRWAGRFSRRLGCFPL
jgi:hypothetical protein